ncbi:MAG: hypothetical protein MRY78_04185 [Saprospiraceae bacterium]|nr:hypothetical protein [Saprospiraceae bacterium]
MSEKKNSRNIIQYLALFLMLIAFPAGSWFYLQKGFEFRKESMDKLQELGTFPNLSFLNYTGDTLSSESLNEKVVLAGVFSLSGNDLDASLKEKLSKLYDQFESRKDFVMLVHLLNADSAQVVNRGEALLAELAFDQPERFYVAGGTTKLALDQYKMPVSESELKSGQHIILCDAKQTIRNHYDLNKEEEVRELIHHITIVLPRLQEKDIIFKRETEK